MFLSLSASYDLGFLMGLHQLLVALLVLDVSLLRFSLRKLSFSFA